MTPAARRWDNDAIWNRAPVARVMFPPESFFYATEPPPVDPKEKKNLHELKPGQGVLQFQRWMPFVKIGTSDEPVGDWVVADVVVTRGQLVGGKQFVSLPLWSSQYNRYMLRETAELKLKSKEPAKRGVMMDPTSTLPTMLAVEVEGGKQSPGSAADTARTIQPPRFSSWPKTANSRFAIALSNGRIQSAKSVNPRGMIGSARSTKQPRN